jgi:hypothetical protein
MPDSSPCEGPPATLNSGTRPEGRGRGGSPSPLGRGSARLDPVGRRQRQVDPAGLTADVEAAPSSPNPVSQDGLLPLAGFGTVTHKTGDGLRGFAVPFPLLRGGPQRSRPRLEQIRANLAPARDNRRDRPYEPGEQARAAPIVVPTLPWGRVREDSLMDGSRRRRTKDQVRKAWYARHRQRRFARRLGFPEPVLARVRSCPGTMAGP